MADLDCLKNVKKFAVLGGTFDPIHNGHMAVAKGVLEKTGVDKILFIPSGRPPHKDLFEVSSPHDRLEMTKLATECDNMEVSSIEIDRDGTTYTVDTIIELKAMLDDVEFKFVTGADALHYVTTWKNYKKLFEICDFIVVGRPGYNKSSLLSDIHYIETNLSGRIEYIELPPIDISSSEIRQLVREGKSISGFVPKKVEEYILVNKLYKK